MRGIRANLSAYKYRGDLLKAFNSCSVTIVCGQTGCGKSTQVPQYVLEDYIEMGKGAECNIICTQSRRLSAIGLADRVSKERSQAASETVSLVVLDTSILLVHSAVKSNNTLHVILMSATVDASLFANYFSQGLGYSPPVMTIPGFRFPVRELYLEDALELTANDLYSKATQQSLSVVNESIINFETLICSILQLELEGRGEGLGVE
ncbi:unnamed protein product [Sphagnum balticum]